MIDLLVTVFQPIDFGATVAGHVVPARFTFFAFMNLCHVNEYVR